MPFHRLTRRHLVVLSAALFTALAALVGGAAERTDRLLDPLQFAAWPRPAGQQIVLVEMDAASVAAIRQWPWSRDHYAAVVDQLRAAGAASVTFDVDFSSPSTTAGDAAFAAALARADGLVALATFAQQASSGDRRAMDSLPLPAFRSHVALASVSMQPDPDGIVRRAPFGTVTAGVPRPSLSSIIAQRSGRADDFFPIDFGIDPDTIPRLSFVDVRDGRFAPGVVKGRDVLIGATAIEMGDRYASPRWGVIPGVMVQAIAAETLMRGVPVERSAFATIAAALMLAIFIVACARPWTLALTVVSAAGLLFTTAVWAQVVRQEVYPLAVGLLLLAAAAAGRVALFLLDRFDRQRRFDEDTGLPNRRAMVHDLAAQENIRVAVARMGNFDNLLTVLGEQSGHDLVMRLADRLRLVGGSPVYRLSDHLLGLVIDRDSDLAEAMAALRSVLLQPVEVRGRMVDAAVHVGVADEAIGIEDLLTRATRAADEAVADGTFWRHALVDMAALEQRLILMGELDRALAAGEIEVHYQPKLALARDQITSVEALVRWRHPDRGMVPPDLFIPLAEKADRIEPLTLFVLDRVIRDLAVWRAAGLNLTAAVNVSARLIAVSSFDAAVRDRLRSGRISPASLILEVTESATLSEPQRAAATLGEWRDLGVAISMDDYGTGQSTLSYLQQLPLSELKIDRSFVQHAHHNHADGLMVRSTVKLAHGLGLKVVAEGVEDEACLTFLRDIGCDMAQGYFISRPLPADDLTRMLQPPAIAA